MYVLLEPHSGPSRVCVPIRVFYIPQQLLFMGVLISITNGEQHIIVLVRGKVLVRVVEQRLVDAGLVVAAAGSAGSTEHAGARRSWN